MDIFQVAFDAFGVAVVMAVFIIVLIVSLRVLPEMGFTGGSRITLAICVALLSAMGLMTLSPMAPTNSTSPSESETYDFLLLPYAALGLTLLLLPFIVLIDWCLRTCKEHSRQKYKPSQSTKERHASTLPKPQAIGDGKDVRRTACGDRERIQGAGRDQSILGKRRFRQ